MTGKAIKQALVLYGPRYVIRLVIEYIRDNRWLCQNEQARKRNAKVTALLEQALKEMDTL